MRPVLFGLPVSGYGVSKALAALVAAWLLAKEFRRLGWDPDLATPVVMRATLFGFAGAKAYYLLEHAGSLTLHDLGGSGFTWYGGFLAGVTTIELDARHHHHLPVGLLAGAAALPLSVAYGIGRLGCLLAGDGTDGRPSGLPWAVAFPHGTVPTSVAVHPTPAYESLAAFAIAGVHWLLRDRVAPTVLFGVYAVLTGTARVLVEVVRVNRPVVLGLTQPQLWSLVLVVVGGVLVWRGRHRRAAAPVALV